MTTIEKRFWLFYFPYHLVGMFLSVLFYLKGNSFILCLICSVLIFNSLATEYVGIISTIKTARMYSNLIIKLKNSYNIPDWHIRKIMKEFINGGGSAD